MDAMSLCWGACRIDSASFGASRALSKYRFHLPGLGPSFVSARNPIWPLFSCAKTLPCWASHMTMVQSGGFVAHQCIGALGGLFVSVCCLVYVSKQESQVRVHL
uniref:Uncharacterized protein n=1 Tax=Eutreptiella gymnastica TaxID=73025 RepID=A0A7S4GMI3_9EUGL